MSKGLKFVGGVFGLSLVGLGGFTYYKNPKAFENFDFSEKSFKELYQKTLLNFNDTKNNSLVLAIQKQDEKPKAVPIIKAEEKVEEKIVLKEEKKEELERAERQKIEKERLEKERLEKERVEKEENLKQVVELQENLEKHKKEVQKLNSNLNENIKELDALKKVLDSYQKEHDNTKTSNLKEIQELQKEVERHQKTISTLNHQKEAKEQELKEEVVKLSLKLEQVQQAEKESTSLALSQQKEQLEKEFKEKNFERIENLTQVQAKAFITEKLVFSNLQFVQESSHFQKVSLVLFSLQEVLETNAPFHPELEEILALSQDDNFVKVVVNSVSKEVAEKGVDTCLTLSQEFSKVKNDAIGLSYIPNSSGFFGNIFAKFISKFLIPEKGFVDGDAPDAVLARAEYYLEHKRLAEAVKELEKLDGKCAQYLEGFMKKAKNRLVAEQMFNVLKSHYMNQIEKIQ